jgi:hypothetical protein
VPDPFLRIDHDHDDIVNFCSRNNHPIPWTPEMLKDCVVVRAFDDEGTIGFFLGHWYLEPGLMYLHVCIDEGRRGEVVPTIRTETALPTGILAGC